ncbi:GNAT family N-acetyltransferase [Bradyrhizobium liaoningense]|uniref:GNAT family N-acetyltransferase n=1 Tax=Bradyrhizobium liaoningense TaxID=43992 RepID=UPI0005595F3D|nr:GNAT family N-acetyltransferase [Bradyrhizobium liaoningense]
MSNAGFTVTVGWQSDSIEKLISLHARHYIDQHKFGRSFESAVENDLKNAMARSSQEPHKCNIISAIAHCETVGAVVIDGNEPGREALGARFRWLFVAPSHERLGVAPAIIKAGMEFVKLNEFNTAYLTTYQGKNAARSLFLSLGFEQSKLVEPQTIGASVDEEVWVWSRQF